MNSQTKKDYCLKWVRKIQDNLTPLKASKLKALQVYKGDPTIVKALKGRSKLTTTDFQDLVEWLRPAVMQALTSGEDVVTLDPGTEDDVKPVQNLQVLVNKQLKVKNPWFLIIYDLVDDAFKFKNGFVKIHWFKDEKKITREYEWTLDEFNAMALAANPLKVIDQKSIQVDPETGIIKCKMTTIIRDEYVKLDVLPFSEFGYMLSSATLEDSPLVYHRKEYKENEFKKKYGKAVWKKCETYLNKEDEFKEFESELLKDAGQTFVTNDDKNVLYVYECYHTDPETGDMYITDICGEELVEENVNSYGFLPFETITPNRQAHKVDGVSLYDAVIEIMKMRTSLLRQIYDNIYFSNNRRYFGDPTRLNMDDYLNKNAPGALVRTIGAPGGVVMPEEKAPLPSEVFNFWEMLNIEKDYHLPVARSFQGVNPKVLNDTWRGQSDQINQSAQRVELMIRLFVEQGIKPIVDKAINLNLTFLKKETIIRHLNEDMVINPDNIIGRYDLTVNVGLGINSKSEQVVHMQQLLGIFAQVRNAGSMTVTDTNLYNVLKTLIRAMGHLNTTDFITDPQEVQMIAQFAMAVMAHIQNMASSGVPPTPELVQLVQMAQAIIAKAGGPVGPTGQSLPKGAPQLETPVGPAQPRQPMTLPSGGNMMGGG